VHRLAAVLAAVFGVVLLGVAAATMSTGGGSGGAGAVATAPSAPGADARGRSIAAAQAKLAASPNDWKTWAELGSAYVEQARITADPSFYPKSDGALAKSVALQPQDNYLALTGMGALANARHDFGRAADNARRSQAINPASASSYGVLADALIQLGDYPGATAAVQQMLNLDPGLSAFTRASYDRELHGLTDQAADLLRRALASTNAPGDIAFCRTYLGLLAFSTGNLDGAAEQYRTGLAAAPGDAVLLVGQAQVDAARGNIDAAVAGYQQAVNIRPLPQYFVEFGELLESAGRTAEAKTQYDLFATTQKLFAANGVLDYLTAAQLEANRGNSAEAIAQAQAEWAVRQNIDAADALAWALHSAGRDAEALPYAQRATALGTKNASFLYHRGVIEAAVGQTAQGRATLTQAMATNPRFSPLYAPRAQAALAALGGPV